MHLFSAVKNYYKLNDLKEHSLLTYKLIGQKFKVLTGLT
jgi:hypothetical protein